jgi:hypothetical protein
MQKKVEKNSNTIKHVIVFFCVFVVDVLFVDFFSLKKLSNHAIMNQWLRQIYFVWQKKLFIHILNVLFVCRCLVQQIEVSLA